MCPYFVCCNDYGLCNCYHEGLMCPSIYERENFCCAVFNACPYYKKEDTLLKDNSLEIEEVSKR